MKRLAIGVTLPLIASTWFLTTQEQIVSRPYSAVQRAYNVITEAMDRLPAKASTLRLWLPIALTPTEENKAVSTPKSSCPFQAARLQSRHSQRVSPNERKPQASSFVPGLMPRLQLGRRLKQPVLLSARPVLARSFGEAELEAFLHPSVLISTFPLDSNLWESNIARKKPVICPGTRDL